MYSCWVFVGGKWVAVSNTGFMVEAAGGESANAAALPKDRKSNRTGGCRRPDATIAGRRVASAAREPTRRDGDEVAISEGAEWACRVVCRGLGAERGASLVSGDDGRALLLHFLVEDVLGLRLRQGIPVRYEINRRVVPGRRSAGGGDPGLLGGLAESQENPPHGGGLRDEGDDTHVGAAAGADERQGEEQTGAMTRAHGSCAEERAIVAAAAGEAGALAPGGAPPRSASRP